MTSGRLMDQMRSEPSSAQDASRPKSPDDQSTPVTCVGWRGMGGDEGGREAGELQPTQPGAREALARSTHAPLRCALPARTARPAGGPPARCTRACRSCRTRRACRPG
jgi:hypothetical protein